MSCAQDASFGPSLMAGPGYCREFDFTLAFEHSMLQILPSALFIFLAVARISSIYKGPKIMSPSTSRPFKNVLYISIFVFQLASLVALSRVLEQEVASKILAILASVTATIATACLGLSSFLEHVRTPGPSMLVQIALSVFLLLDIVLLRTSWILWASSDSLPGRLTLASLQTTASALKLGALLWESWKKDTSFNSVGKGQHFSAEERNGFFGRTLMTWLSPVFYSGYYTDLNLEGLEAIDYGLSGQSTMERLEAPWATIARERRWRLAMALSWAFWFDLVMVHVPRLGLVACSITQPLLINAVLSFMKKRDSSPRNYGYYLVVATFLTYALLTTMTVWSQHLTFRLLTKVRGALVSSIFVSTLETRTTEATSSAQPISLMSTEIDRISYTLQWSLAIVPNLIQVGVGLWILHSYIDKAVVAPALVAIVCGVVAARVGKSIPKRQGQWMKSISARIQVTTNVLAQLKGIRKSGLQSAANKNVLQARDQEIAKQKSFRKLQVCNIVIGNIPAMLTPALTFTFFAIIRLLDTAQSASFDVVTAFSSLSLLAILIMPIAELVAASINITSALTSLDRIQDFLIQNSRDNTDAIAEETDITKPLVCLSSCSLDWECSATKEPLLKDINLDVGRSEVVLILGNVGCGKTLLLNSMIGEAHIANGTLCRTTPTQISYCAQTPWIPNATLREVIVGESAYDESRYAQVVEICQLYEDFAALAHGDESMAGSNGSGLSGGQKQRLALARAIYQPSQLVLLDDSFSALDSHTAKRIAQLIFGDEGFFRKAGSSAVMTSSNESWSRYADRILVLEAGRSTLYGSHIAFHRDHTTSLENKIDCEESTRESPASSATAPVQHQSPVTTATQNREAPMETATGKKSEPSAQGSLRHYMGLMGAVRLVIFFAFVVLLVGLTVSQTMWLKFWVARTTTDTEHNLGYWIGIYVGLGLLNITAIAMETSYFFLQIVPRVARLFHANMVCVLNAEMDFLSQRDTGEILNLFAGDLNLIDMPLPLSFLLTSEKLASSVAEAILTCLASGYLAAAMPVVGLAVYFTQRVYLRTSRQLRVLDLEAKAPLVTHFTECFDGRVTIRAMAWKTAVTRKNTEILNTSQKPYYLLYCLQRWLNLVLDLITTALATLLVGIAVSQRDRDNVDIGYLAVGLVSVMGFGQTLSQLITHWTNLETSLGAVDRVRKYIASTPLEADNESRSAERHYESPAADIDMRNVSADGRGVVEFHDVSARRCGQVVLNRVSVSFRPGTKTAICGRTGSGKSSLLDALLRMLLLDGGNITLDGTNVKDISLATVREKVVALPQDALLFAARTIRENLDPFGRHSGESGTTHIMHALIEVGLAELAPDAASLDKELDTGSLSAGQAQLFGLARVLLRRDQGLVLLLDEATSNLDAGTSAKVYSLVDKFFKDWTVILITHKVEDIVRYGFDQVLVMKNGRVAEMGVPTVLLQQGDASEFASLLSHTH
ncbi:ATP-binding cassette subfamily C (CFTR/MRP) member 1 [Microdochium nivale]|nr:ATP-binding cassette subfamily C (CFTR/MRP) member 1 [Microdochium nivale]